MPLTPRSLHSLRVVQALALVTAGCPSSRGAAGPDPQGPSTTGANTPASSGDTAGASNTVRTGQECSPRGATVTNDQGETCACGAPVENATAFVWMCAAPGTSMPAGPLAPPDLPA
jgi:hypothetical protein